MNWHSNEWNVFITTQMSFNAIILSAAKSTDTQMDSISVLECFLLTINLSTVDSGYSSFFPTSNMTDCSACFPTPTSDERVFLVWFPLRTYCAVVASDNKLLLNISWVEGINVIPVHVPKVRATSFSLTLYTAVLLLLHPFNGLSRTTSVSRHQKGKPFWILLEQEMMGWQWHQLDHMLITGTSCHASTSQLYFYRPDAFPDAQPTASKHWRHTTYKQCQLSSPVKDCNYKPTSDTFLSATSFVTKPVLVIRGSAITRGS